MDRARRPETFGTQLRRWRQNRGLSQLALSQAAEVSTRHLSWLETDKSEPSRAMVLRLADRLDLPLRERNALLLAAGFAPLYGEHALADAALTPAREALQRLLKAHEPAPALAVDRHWNIVAANAMVEPLLHWVAPELRKPPINSLRISLHPQGLAPMMLNLATWREHALARLQRQVQLTGDPVLAALHRELSALPPPAAPPRADAADRPETADPADAVIVPLTFVTPLGRLCFLSTVTVFGAPHEVTLAELAVETLLPADAATAAVLAQVYARIGAG